jgi:threonine dehydrogenase-like Zn-dependent dehydrogenase
MIARVGDKIDKLVTHKFPMSRAKEAFEAQLSRKCGKIFLYPLAVAYVRYASPSGAIK